MEKIIDVLIMSSSRPQLLPYCVDSLYNMIFSCTYVKPRFLLHEDFVIPKESEKVIEYAKSQGFDVIEKHKPNIGQGFAMNHMLKFIKSKYLFRMEDDWEFERPVDLDKALWIMDKYPLVNCIIFNKNKNCTWKMSIGINEYDFEGQKLTLSAGWFFIPGIWRMDKVRKHWSAREFKPEGHWQDSLREKGKKIDKEYCYNKIGAYFYGGKDDYRYIRHLGNTWKMENWKKKEVDESLVWDFVGLKSDRAPWIGKLPKRPINFDIKLTKKGKEIYDKAPQYIKEMFKDGLK